MVMRNQLLVKVIDAQQATGAGKTVLCEDHRHLNFVLATSGLGGGDSITVKVQGSLADEAPDFDAAKSITNMWDYVDSKDMENTQDYDGDTGIVITGADDVIQLSINVDGLKWLTLNVTGIDSAADSVTGLVKLFND